MMQTHDSLPVDKTAPHGSAERGFLLMSTGVILLVVIAILSSFSFVSQRDARFKANYAAGQRLADLAVMAHNYTQIEHYASSLDLDGAGDLYNATYLNPPDNFDFPPITNTTFDVEVLGRNAAPQVAASSPAASAYIHLKVRPRAGTQRSATDTVAFLAGASSNGLSRVGVVASGAHTCPAFIGTGLYAVWGSEPSACLSESDMLAIGFTDVQEGDIIVPAWEVALSRNRDQVVFRYPQPERPNTSSMTVALNMNGNNIQSIATMRGETIQNAAGTANIQGDMLVRNGANATLQQADTNGSLRIYGGPMNIDGPIALNVGTMNVASTVQATGGTMDVIVANTPRVDRVGTATTNLTVEPIAGGPNVLVNVENIDPASTINDLTIQQDGRRLKVNRSFNSNNHVIQPRNTDVNVYAGSMTVDGTQQITPGPSGTTDWSVGAIDQQGSGVGHGLQVDRLQTNECIGRACPDNVIGPPGGGV